MVFPRQENPDNMSIHQQKYGPGDSHQLSPPITSLPEWTNAGSAYVGELRILREYSFDEAMTIKLVIISTYSRGS